MFFLNISTYTGIPWRNIRSKVFNGNVGNKITRHKHLSQKSRYYSCGKNIRIPGQQKTLRARIGAPVGAARGTLLARWEPISRTRTRHAEAGSEPKESQYVLRVQVRWQIWPVPLTDKDNDSFTKKWVTGN